MIKPRLELLKNRAIEHGKDWIDYNQRKFNDVKSLKDTNSNNKRCFNKHQDKQKKGSFDAMIFGKRLKLHPR